MIQTTIFITKLGLFVWLSFGITLAACALLYYRTYKTLKKYEKDFAKELNELPAQQRSLVLEKSKVATQILASYKKSI
jgi:heme exporter protein D